MSTSPIYGSYKVKYIRGLSAYPKQEICRIHVHQTHIEISRMKLIIPLEQIERVRTIKKRHFMLTFRNSSGLIQNPVFYSGRIDEAKRAIFDAKSDSQKQINTKQKIVEPQLIKEKIIIREKEIEIVYCQHCKIKNNARSTYCSHCGAPLR